MNLEVVVTKTEAFIRKISGVVMNAEVVVIKT